MSRKQCLTLWVWLNGLLVVFGLGIYTLVGGPRVPGRDWYGEPTTVHLWTPFFSALGATTIHGFLLLLIALVLVFPSGNEQRGGERRSPNPLECAILSLGIPAILLALLPWWVNVISTSLVGWTIIGVTLVYLNLVLPSVLFGPTVLARLSARRVAYRTTRYNEDGLVQREAALRAEIEHLERIAQEAGR